MKTRLRWLDRSLLFSPYYYALCTTPEVFEKELKRLGVAPRERPVFVKGGSDAQCVFLRSSDGKPLCLVCIKKQKGRSREAVYALLIHEGVHLWQAIKKEIGESAPGDEGEAYAIQNISLQLMSSYREQVKR
jgi:hypothetical protein